MPATYSQVITLYSGNLANPQQFESPVDKSSFPNSWQFICEPNLLFYRHLQFIVRDNYYRINPALAAASLQCFVPTAKGLRLL